MAVSDDMSGSPEGAVSPSQPAGTRPRVLCIDDEPHNLDLLDRCLRRQFEVLTEAMPDAALQSIAAHEDITVVLADYRMALLCW